MDDIDRSIIDNMQGGLRVCERPFLEPAHALGISEEDLIVRLQHLLARGVLARIGPLYQIERMGGAFTMAALSAPEECFDDVAMRVNAMPEVAYNYRHDHLLNMWFVLATRTPEEIADAIRAIERDTGCKVFNFPAEREYFVELKLKA